jgi:UDP-N-acetylglucosamine 2-epimerase
MSKPRILTVVGTRPELIKLSLVIKALDRATNHILVHTGQNFDYELNEVFFKDLGIRKPDHFLNCARASAVETIGTVMMEVDKVLEIERPDAVVIYGDTNSALSAIPAKKRQIPIFHLEAGNRSFDQRVPEELNRKIVDHLSDINMTITEHARRYLLSEGLPPERVMKIGSCMPEIFEKFRPQIDSSAALETLGLKRGEYFLVSTHREENVDRAERLGEIVAALRELHKKYKIPVIVSTHPRTRKRLEAFDIDLQQDGLTFMKPLGFFDYVKLQMNAKCVLSDSGTITEESAILHFPAITLRDAHERPEGTEVGVLIKAPIRKDAIINAVDVTLSRTTQPDDVPDYAFKNVSETALAVILSNIDYVNRVVWRKV